MKCAGKKKERKEKEKEKRNNKDFLPGPVDVLVDPPSRESFLLRITDGKKNKIFI